MTDLRTAAQQALEQLKINRTNFRKGPSKSICKMLAGGNDEAIADLEAALAEPVQEPVAWMETENFVDGENLWDSRTTFNQQGNGTPLYTAPPQRKPLMDEQVRDLWSWAMTAEAERTATTQQHAFARAIERAHGI